VWLQFKLKGLLPETSEDAEPKDEELDFEKYYYKACIVPYLVVT
jgi:hypothetical protein